MRIVANRGGRLAVLAAVAALAGCQVPNGGGANSWSATPPPPLPVSHGAPVATVVTSSGNGAIVSRSGGGQEDARPGTLLYNGDIFATDARSTMQLRLLRAQGGTIDVQPGTDPLLQDAACFLISFFHRGTLEVRGHNICVQGSGSAEVMQDSDVVYQIAQRGGTMRVTVREGRVTLRGQPGRAWTTGQSFELRGNAVVGTTPGAVIGRGPAARGTTASSPAPIVR